MSVLYARTGPPAPYFVAHHGWTNNIGRSQTATTLRVAPFVTPAGGVKFNRMSTLILNVEPRAVGGTLSFGIDDRRGRLVANSDRLVFNEERLRHLVEIAVPETFLQPSRIYYTGWTVSNNYLSIASGPIPPVPGYGVVLLAVTDGTIPEQFNPDHIAWVELSPPVLPVAMWLDDSSSETLGVAPTAPAPKP